MEADPHDGMQGVHVPIFVAYPADVFIFLLREFTCEM
jgi:hypothetical protein